MAAMPHERSCDFLFTTWEGGGNVPPVLTVARRLAAGGHRVRVMSDRCDRAEVEAAGAAFVPWHRAPSRPDKSAVSAIVRDWDVPAADGFARLRDAIMCGPALDYALDVLDELDRRPADLVVSSEMLFGVMAACEARRQPLALLAANLCLFPVPGMPPFGAGLAPARTEEERALHAAHARAGAEMLAVGLPAVNKARKALDLPPIGSLLDQLEAADRLLLGTSRAFDFPAALPYRVRYVGPQLDELSWVRPWTSPWPADDDRPLVLVAFSTTFQNQAKTVQRVIDAASRLPIRAVVTLGPNLSGRDVRCRAENVQLCASAPHGSIMPQAAAVLTHGGHGTLMRALVHQVPVLCMPMGRDQNDNAARLVFHGAGLSLPPEAPSTEIGEALRRILAERSFTAAARRLGGAVAGEAAFSPVVAELVHLARLPRQAARAAGAGRAA
jgi:UDP:flavonoid glycosyltransferase YjiC (YdhE family)